MPNAPSGRRGPPRPTPDADPAHGGGRPFPFGGRPAWTRGRAALAAAAIAASAALFAGVALLAGIPLGLPHTPIGVGDGSPPVFGPSQSPAASAPRTPRAVSPSPPPSTTEAPTPTLPTDIPAALLQGQLDSLQAKLSIPGVSVAILWNDGRTWLGVAGMANVEGKVPVTPGTAFALASISKTFTAAVVLELVEEGRLALDQRVAPLLPAYGLDARITVRMLLDHTSGLPDFFANPTIDKALQSAPNVAWTPARSYTFVAARRPVPGSVWTYSNTNYLVLGQLVTAVTGRPLAAEVRARLLDPLGLAATWYQVAEAPREAITTGYRLVAGSGGSLRAVRVSPAVTVMPFRSVVTASGGAGSIAATALDTARWMRAFAGGQVLSAGMQLAMLADVVRTAPLRPEILYGLGIQAATIDGRTALGHSGRFLGFRDVVRYLPVPGVTIAVLTNQSSVDPAVIASALLELVLPPLPTPSPSASPGASPDGPTVSPSAGPTATAGP